MIQKTLIIMMALTVSAFANAETECPSPAQAGASKVQVRVAQLVSVEGSMTIITPNNNGRNLKIADTLCFSKAKLDKIAAASAAKTPITLVVKDNAVLEVP